MDPQAEEDRKNEKIKQIDKCLKELTYYVDSMLKVVENPTMRIYMPGESLYTVVDEHLFTLACYMRREDNREYLGQNNDLTDKILNGVRPIMKKLKKEKGELKKLGKHIDRWLTKHNAKRGRNMFISSKKCGSKLNLKEEMPAYLLKAITKEKSVHPVYGNLRY